MNPETNCTYSPGESWENCGKPPIVWAKITFQNGLRLLESACKEHIEEFNRYFSNGETSAKIQRIEKTDGS